MSVTIDLSPNGKRIFLLSPYPTPGLSRTVAGASFSKEGGAHWSIPLSIDACRALRERFGTDLKVGRSLADWARTEIAVEREMTALGRAADADLELVPKLAPKLAEAFDARPFQRAGVRFIAQGLTGTGRGALVADQPGLGKTLQAIGGIIESGIPGPYLVVCPKTAVESVWAREVPRWWPDTSVVTVPDGRAARDAILHKLIGRVNKRNLFTEIDRTWVVVHPEMMRTTSYWNCEECGAKTKYKAGPKKLDCEHDAYAPRFDEHVFPQLFAVQWGVVVTDESDRALIRRTGTPNLTRRGMELVESSARLAMSGTPFRARPTLLWGTLNWLFPKIHTSFWRFAETYFEVEDAGWGGSRKVGDLREDKAHDLDRLLSKSMIRRTKEEVASDMPLKTYGGTPLDPNDAFSPVGVWLPMEGEQKRLYDKMAAESMVALEGGELNAIGILAEMTRLKQFATSAGRMEGTTFRPGLPSNKADWLVEHLLELGYPDLPTTKIIVVSQFVETLDAFRAAVDAAMLRASKDSSGDRLHMFRASTAALTGRLTGARRTALIDSFNAPVGSDSPHILFLQVKTGGVAITIDSADEMVFLDETWVPDDQEQAEDRIHRLSKPRPVTYWYLRSQDSIDEVVAVVNAEKRRSSSWVLDGRRGVEYAREILNRLR